LLKYGGSLLICLGIGVMFYMREYFFKKTPQTSQSHQWTERQGFEQPSLTGV